MITIRGSGFGDGATVTFDGVAATDVVVVDATEITCTPPAHADGLVTVIVTNPDGTMAELAGVFCYTTLSLDVEEGPIAGGTTVTLTISDGGAGIAWFPAGHTFLVFIDNRFRALGTDLADPDLILNPAIGGQVPSTRLSDVEIEAETLAQPCGPTDVVVFDMDLYAAGEPNVVFYLPLGFTYQLDAPTLTDIDPTSGAARGGTHVTLTGTFSCVTCSGGGTVHVALGGAALTSVSCGATSITGITGLHAVGVVDVVVTNPDGQTVTLPAAYTYVDAPTVLTIDPDHGPDAGGTDVTITGTGFEDGATVAMRGLDPDGLPTLADCTSVVVVDDETITATTSAHPAAVVDVVVTNPDGQSAMLERGYSYEGWWTGVFEDEEDSEIEWWTYGARRPGLRWRTELLLAPPVDGWWMSTAAFGGAIYIIASSRPKDPRTWPQIAAFATGSADVFGGSPGIAVVFRNRMVYAASDYTVGVTFPPIRIYDGSFDRELCRLPPAAGNAVPIAVMSMLVANGTIYLSTLDSGSSSADWVGRVFSLDLATAALTPIGTPFPTGHLPYALAWHNGMLWCGTHRQTTDAGKVFSFRPNTVDAAWVEDVTFPAGVSVAALLSWRGELFAGTTAPAGSFAQVRKRGSDNTWSTADTGSGGTATANNAYLSLGIFGDALYAGYWNHDTPAVAKIRKTIDGTTWSTVYTGAAGTIRPFIVLLVDNNELFAIGGGGHLTAAILRSSDGAVWTDLTSELPDADKTALPAAAVLVF